MSGKFSRHHSAEAFALCAGAESCWKIQRLSPNCVWLHGFTTSFKIVSLYSIYFFVLIENLGKSWTDTLLQNICRTLYMHSMQSYVYMYAYRSTCTCSWSLGVWAYFPLRILPLFEVAQKFFELWKQTWVVVNTKASCFCWSKRVLLIQFTVFSQSITLLLGFLYISPKFIVRLR